MRPALSLQVLEEGVFEALEPVARGSIDDVEIARAKRQLRARLVFEDDSVTNVAHQLGFYETVVGPGFYPRLRPCIDAVTPDQVRDVARRRLQRSLLTVGSFRPVEAR
jgi:predicted Zn-dependent peptidase